MSNDLTYYMVVSSIYLAVFYLFYLLFLSNDTNYRLNRIYLLTSVIGSLLLPLLKIGLFTASTEATPAITRIIAIREVIVTATSSNTTQVNNWANLVYVAGVVSTIILFTTRFLSLARLMPRKLRSQRVIYTDNIAITGFTALGYIFVSKSLDPLEQEKVIQHELVHVKKKHTIDLIIIKLATVILWFNPVIYLIGRSMRIVHEYQADEDVINGGENIVSYQKLILNQLFNTSVFSMMNGFSGKSLIKKRMIMMTRKRSGKIAGLKLLALLPVLTLMVILFSCETKSGKELTPVDEPTQEMAAPEKPAAVESVEPDAAENIKENQESVFKVVEEMPSFNGGDIDVFRNWVTTNVKYPEIAAKNGIQGQVFVKFIVDREGNVKDAKILKGVDPSLDNEALRVVKESPKWKPGRQSGKNVNVAFNITVNFQLS